MISAPGSVALAGVPFDLWADVAGARHRLLMLDYDGTLVPFHDRPEVAQPGKRVLSLIERIASSPETTLAVVSGRPLSHLVEFMGLLPVILIGEHGWELRRRDGHVDRHPLPPACAAGLDRAAELAAAAGPDGRIERKRASIVLHTRGLPRERADAIHRAVGAAWGAAAAGGDLRLDAIDGGLELRSPQRDKGVVVRELMAEAPPGTLPVYLGDDVTDEDAFRAVLAPGYGVRVGPEPRESCANGRLESVEAVVPFLERWLIIVEGLGRT